MVCYARKLAMHLQIINLNMAKTTFSFLNAFWMLLFCKQLPWNDEMIQRKAIVKLKVGNSNKFSNRKTGDYIRWMGKHRQGVEHNLIRSRRVFWTYLQLSLEYIIYSANKKENSIDPRTHYALNFASQHYRIDPQLKMLLSFLLCVCAFGFLWCKMSSI